jgi:hypothetical protein
MDFREYRVVSTEYRVVSTNYIIDVAKWAKS